MGVVESSVCAVSCDKTWGVVHARLVPCLYYEFRRHERVAVGDAAVAAGARHVDPVARQRVEVLHRCARKGVVRPRCSGARCIFERHILKPGYHLMGNHLKPGAFQLWAAMGQGESTCTAPPREHHPVVRAQQVQPLQEVTRDISIRQQNARAALVTVANPAV
jgi:hypothetical protein